MIDPHNPDVIKYTNVLATNTSGTAESDVGVWLPYIWVRVPTNPVTTEVALTWNNLLQGWYTPDFIGANGDTHESLLVTAKLITGSEERPLAPKHVADESGTSPFSLTTGGGISGGNYFQSESIQPNDLLPFANIGSLGANESKSFEVDFTYHWGGADLGAMRTGQQEATLVPDHPNGSSGIHMALITS
jgi:hypothetical protein